MKYIELKRIDLLPIIWIRYGKGILYFRFGQKGYGLYFRWNIDYKDMIFSHRNKHKGNNTLYFKTWFIQWLT